jgi:hypothetical protein
LLRGQYVNPNCFSVPLNSFTTPGQTANTVGNTRMPYIAGPMYWNSDITLIKKFSITERQSLEFRFAAFNFMNHALKSFTNGDNNLKLNFDGSTGQLTNATDTKNTCPGAQCAAFGYPDVTFGHRQLELAVKYSF